MFRVGIWVFGFGVQGVEWGVWGLGFGVSGFGFRFSVFGLGCPSVVGVGGAGTHLIAHNAGREHWRCRHDLRGLLLNPLLLNPLLPL